MLALPPSSGISANILAKKLRHWQEEGGTKWRVHYKEDGSFWYAEPIPTKFIVDSEIELEKAMDKIFWDNLFGGAWVKDPCKLNGNHAK